MRLYLNREHFVLNSCLLFLFLWPVSDAIRKWTSFNSVVFALQQFVPLLVIFFLFRFRLVKLDPVSLISSCFLVLIVIVRILFASLEQFSFVPPFIALISISQLLCPLLILSSIGSLLRQKSFSLVFGYRVKYFLFWVLVLLGLNSSLTIAQSILGSSHVLSGGVAGVFAQFGTNTFIELRAPGFFTFINSNFFYSTVLLLIIFSLSWCLGNVSGLKPLVLAILSVAVIRSVSRSWIVSSLWVVVFEACSKLTRQFHISINKTIYYFLALMILTPIVFIYFPFEILTSGFEASSERLAETGGFEDVIARFYQTIFVSSGGSDVSLFSELKSWLLYDPLSFFFGAGAGYGSSLSNFLSNGASAYRFFGFDYGRYILLGESNITTLLAEYGVFGIVLYFSFFLSALRSAWRASRLVGFKILAVTQWLIILFMSLNSTSVYTRPSNFLGSCFAALSFSLVIQVIYAVRASASMKAFLADVRSN